MTFNAPSWRVMRSSMRLSVLAFVLMLSVVPIANASVQFQIGANNTVNPSPIAIDGIPSFANPSSQSVLIGASGVSGNRWERGTGWGVDSSEATGTLLDALFSLAGGLPGQSFTLSVGGSQVFQYGSITFSEPDANGGIRNPQELDNLEITAYLSFLKPPSGDIPSATTAVAMQGIVTDPAPDLRISFASQIVPWSANGSFGTFRLDLGQLGTNNQFLPGQISFTTQGSRDIYAQVTLQTELPAPSSFVTFIGLGLLCGTMKAWRRFM